MPQQMLARSAAVATGHPYGTAAGIEILRDGGNAIDAAVAAMIALSVAIPGSVGLGGYGGSAVVCTARSREQGAGSKIPHVFAVDFDFLRRSVSAKVSSRATQNRTTTVRDLSRCLPLSPASI